LQSPEARRRRLCDLQAAIPENAIIIEYFEAKHALHVFLVSRRTLRHLRLGSSTPSRQAARLLAFQLGKFRLSSVAGLQGSNLEAAREHLRELHALLIAPLEPLLSEFEHLIIAPHRYLHGMPFSALNSSLNDGHAALIDRFTLSSTPSSQVFLNCRNRPPGSSGPAVVMTVPDAKAPAMEQEAKEVNAVLPGSTLLSGNSATVAAFRHYTPSARILHLATHGFFRHDNPMYSSIQLADERLSLNEIQHIPMACRLLTLSACSTGSSIAVGADELLGLMRGFLTAGARSLLLTLWEIDDRSTSQFMAEFYRRLTRGSSLPVAVAEATRTLKDQYSHPYYWAPFLLVGDPEALRD
jgi:CHAT domain-containing protein